MCLYMILGQMPNSGKFSLMNHVIYSSLCAFMPPKVNCAICNPKLVYVCVCLHMILGQMPNSGKFFPANHVIYSSLCAFLCLPK